MNPLAQKIDSILYVGLLIALDCYLLALVVMTFGGLAAKTYHWMMKNFRNEKQDDVTGEK